MKRNVAIWLTALLCLFVSVKISGQTLTAKNVSITTNTSGFYEYLPKGYDPNGGTKYPVIIFFHGVGEGGVGFADLPRLLGTGLPALINSGRFPVSFNSGGNTYSFIVLMPQFHGGGGLISDGDPLIDYALNNYKADPDRIYMTGLSIGGGNVWQYPGSSVDAAKRLAAIVPICGAQPPNASMAQNMASANLPVWATQNLGDPVVPAQVTIDWINEIINSNPRDAVPPKLSLFPVNSHDAWSQTYDPNFKDNNMNIYEWMLQYNRASQSLLPVTLGNYSVSFNNNDEAVVEWTTLTESNNKAFVVEKSTDASHFSALDSVKAGNLANGQQYSLVDRHPVAGNNYYRLKQIDIDGKTKYFSIVKLAVRSNGAAGLRISPNPVVSNFQIEWTNADKGRVNAVLSDMQGRQIRVWQFEKKTSTLIQGVEISNLTPGHYNLRVVGDIHSDVQQLIKQ